MGLGQSRQAAIHPNSRTCDATSEPIRFPPKSRSVRIAPDRRAHRHESDDDTDALMSFCRDDFGPVNGVMGEADLLYLPQKNVPGILYPTTEEGSRRVEASMGVAS